MMALCFNHKKKKDISVFVDKFSIHFGFTVDHFYLIFYLVAPLWDRAFLEFLKQLGDEMMYLGPNKTDFGSVQ